MALPNTRVLGGLRENFGLEGTIGATGTQETIFDAGLDRSISDVPKGEMSSHSFLLETFISPDRRLQSRAMHAHGNRSLLLRDPDGTLINLYAPMTAEAKLRLARQ